MSTINGLGTRRRGGPRIPLERPTAAGLMYSDTGSDGPVVVLLHGVLINGALWDTVVDGLRDRYRCIVPELPFGAHTTPMPDVADLSLPALVTLIAGFLTELDLHQVTLVCNDWGGEQLVMAAPIVSPTWSWSGVRPSTTTCPSCPTGRCTSWLT